jgi:hypothetical protein
MSLTPKNQLIYIISYLALTIANLTSFSLPASAEVCIVNDRGETVCGKQKSSRSNVVQHGDIIVSLKDCKRANSLVTCNISVKTEVNRTFFFRPNWSELIDANGKVYTGSHGAIGPERGVMPGISMIQDVDYAGHVVFPGVPDDVNQLQVVKMYLANTEFVFRKVSITS